MPLQVIVDSLSFIGLMTLWLTVINITFWAAVEIDRDELEENTKRIVPVHNMTGEDYEIELDQEEGENDEEGYDF